MYDAETCDQDPNFDDDSEFSFGCTYAQYLTTSAGQNYSQSGGFDLGQSAVKSFHPKSVAFEEIAREHGAFIASGLPPPLASVDGGVLECLPAGNWGDASTYVTKTDITLAVNNFCNGITNYASAASGGYGYSGAMKFQITVDYSIESGCPQFDPLSITFNDFCSNSFMAVVTRCKQTSASPFYVHG